MNLVPPEVAVLIHTIEVGSQRFRNLPNLGNDLLSVRKDDKDVLVYFFIVGGINDRIRNL